MSQTKLFTLSLTLLLTIGLLSCNSVYTPKQRGYFRIDFPQHQYQKFDQPDFPYTFEYPVYANIVHDTTYFDTVAENPYWINVDFPRFGARIYISYKMIGKNSFEKLRNDAYKMTYKHSYKASSIDDSAMHTPNGVAGVYFKVGGNAATANQFYVSDTTHNFLRGALYFDTTPNEDSLAPVNRFLESDMQHLINTFRWKTPGTPTLAGHPQVAAPISATPAGPSTKSPPAPAAKKP